MSSIPAVREQILLELTGQFWEEKFDTEEGIDAASELIEENPELERSLERVEEAYHRANRKASISWRDFRSFTAENVIEDFMSVEEIREELEQEGEEA